MALTGDPGRGWGISWRDVRRISSCRSPAAAAGAAVAAAAAGVQGGSGSDEALESVSLSDSMDATSAWKEESHVVNV